jgi:hypothetical protein
MAHDNSPNTYDTVIDRYSGLARIAAAGGTPVDGDPDTFTHRATLKPHTCRSSR